MTNKKLETKRLIIFLLLAFGISWIPAIIFNKVFGYHEWFETNKLPVLYWIVGFGPALANVITRKLTHEGWHDSKLHFNFRGNIRYYIISILIISVISVFQGIFVTMTAGHNDWSDAGGGMNFKQILTLVLTVFTIAPLMAFNTFGEEFGWRGYMNDKMEKLMGTTGTVLVGGILWGLWHAELTVEGHNFGTDYPGFPYLGIIYMCLSCTATGMVLMWLTKKTNSIYPAAICHAMNNFGGLNAGNLLMSGISDEFWVMKNYFIMDIPLYATGIIFLVMMLRDNKKKNKQ